MIRPLLAAFLVIAAATPKCGSSSTPGSSTSLPPNFQTILAEAIK